MCQRLLRVKDVRDENSLTGRKRPLAVTASVALATLGIAAPVVAAPAGDDSETSVAQPQNTNTEPVTIDLVGITDFHGHITAAPYIYPQIEEIRDANPNTYFSSSGDSIGGSAYISAIAEDVPTLEVLDAMGLDASAVGNHEFDKGYADLTDRVMEQIDFTYLGANVEGADEIAVPPYKIFDVDGVSVAYIGTVTADTPSVVAGAGVEGLTFHDPVVVTNQIAADLKDGDEANGEADIVVSVFHEGANFATGMSENVDLVFSGHTHVVADTETDAGAPILQAGEYGTHFGHATFTVGVDGEVTLDQATVVEVDMDGIADADLQAMVDEAQAQADILGQEVLADIEENAYRGANDGTDMGANRGTESSLGNHLANSYLLTANALPGGADIGVINPGGIREDMDQDDNGEVTYGEAFSVSPFGNTIGTIDLTGQQVYEMLEQQFQPTQSRPVLRLGLSDNVTYTYDPTATDGGDIINVWIDGELIDLTATYRIASNNFLLDGGDNFTVFNDGTNFIETGIIDLEGYASYLRSGAAETIPAGQRSIGMEDVVLVAGETAELELSSLTFTALEAKPDTVTVYLGDEEVGTADIDTTVTPNRDDTGKATVSVDIPEDAMMSSELRIVTTFDDDSVDTDVTIDVDVQGGVTLVDLVGITDFHGYIETAPYMQTMINEIRDSSDSVLFSSSGDSIGGSAYVSAIAEDVPTLEVLNAMGLDVSAVGNHEFDKGYADLTDRVMPLVDFPYLGANVEGADEINDPPYHLVDVDGITVAYIGTVTDDTPSIVAGDGVEGLTFNDPVTTTNEIAADLKDGDAANGEADLVVALFHEGDSFAKGMSEDVDLVFSGHTHVVSETETDAGAPILQAGEHGSHFGQATYTVTADGEITLVDAKVVEVPDSDGDVAPDAVIQAIVDDAIAEADILGQEVLAEIEENAYRGTNDGTDTGANRGTESSLGNHIANAALLTANELPGGADFGIINPGGIRNDMDPNDDGDVTYGEAFSVSPFGNTIGTIDLTGEQVYEMLEQQFQPEQSRPVLRLGLSDDVTYTYDPEGAQGERIIAVYLDGELIDLDATYTIASNTFLLAGGDNFDVFTEGTNFTETGIVDLEGYVSYLRSDAAETIPAGQRSIGITGDFVGGKTATVDLSSLVFTALEEKPTTVTVHFDGVEVGSADIDATVTPDRDETGRATVRVPVPGDTGETADLRIVTTFADGSVDTDVTVDVEVAPMVILPAGKSFYVSNDWTSTVADIEFAYGRVGDEVLVGDWDGDGKDTFAVRRGTTFYVTNELKGGNAEVQFNYGRTTDEVLVGDWDGDGKDTFAVRRGTTFYTMNELKGGNAADEFKYGRLGDEVLVGDWDGDDVDTLTVRRGNTFYVNNELKGGNASHEFNYGRSTDAVFAGDYDGDGLDSISIRRGHTFIINNQLKGGNVGQTLSYGRVADDVFVGDWDGDGIDTPAVRR